MASKAAIIASTSKFRKWQGERIGEDAGMPNRINQLVKEIQAERVDFIKEKNDKNGKKVESCVDQLLRAASANEGIVCTLASRTDSPLCKFSGFSHGVGDKDVLQIHEVVFSSVTKLPYAERLPPYTTWIFLDRNQRMADDQSVVGRRRIYYDQHGSETLICSDSEEEAAEPNEQKQVYSEAEDRLIWMAFKEYDNSDEVLKTVSQFVRGTALEIQERYKVLQQQYHEENNRSVRDPAGFEPVKGISLEKTLGASLDSFDNLFCRRCLVFDCRLHGCSQSIVTPSERLPYVFEPDDGKPCSDQCHRHLKSIRKSPEGSVISTIYRRKSKTVQVVSDAEEKATTEVTVIIDNQEHTSAETKHISPSRPAKDDRQNLHQQDIGGMENIVQKHLGSNDSDVVPAGSSNYPSKKQKKLMSSENPEVDSRTVDIPSPGSHKHTSEVGGQTSEVDEGNKAKQGHVEKPHNSGGHGIMGDGAEAVGTSLLQVVQAKPNSSEWRPIEKELYLKGIEIFGRNSCLIARNMLSGLKTCVEVSSYMHNGGSWAPHRSITASNMIFDDNSDAYMDYAFKEERNFQLSECTCDISQVQELLMYSIVDIALELEMPTRSRFIRKRGRTRKLKYSWKSAGHPSMWKRIADGKHRSCKQYLPCGCKTTCGKECPCLENGTCCEKYCGCSKSCKNRFRGCHCAKSQCRSRQCPCFAAGRECDPDVCRNCWVSCGDGSLGEPPRRGDGQCGNMRLLLRQQQRILLSKSDVAGWGAFLKKPVNKNDYLGEYTGELISHREADKRGKIYDRANSSFLFDLNDQYVLDAYRKGDKLKFANHSSNPNCYAKVMLVAGDHRVGIFAKDHIEASEELFYDYRYGPDQAPAWARKPEGSKRDDVSHPQGRAKKHQSH